MARWIKNESELRSDEVLWLDNQKPHLASSEEDFMDRETKLRVRQEKRRKKQRDRNDY